MAIFTLVFCFFFFLRLLEVADVGLNAMVGGHGPPQPHDFPQRRRNSGISTAGFNPGESNSGQAYLVRRERDLVDGVGIFGWLEVEERSRCVNPRKSLARLTSPPTVSTLWIMYIYRALLKSTCLLTTE